eukprot:5963536-Pleurochrysis_carterae.AAC.8
MPNCRTKRLQTSHLPCKFVERQNLSHIAERVTRLRARRAAVLVWRERTSRAAAGRQRHYLLQVQRQYTAAGALIATVFVCTEGTG